MSALLIWVLVALLLGAAVGLVVLIGKNDRLSRQVDSERARVKSLGAEIDYWIGQANSTAVARYGDALRRIVALRTGKMANVGHRMSAIAADALK